MGANWHYARRAKRLNEVSQTVTSPNYQPGPTLDSPGDPRNDAKLRWYVVQTHARAEDVAERNLLQQSIRTYLPKRERTIRHARKTTTVHSAYFECYLFVLLDIGRQSWYAINSTVGVRKLLTAGEAPTPAPHGLVEWLISATDDNGILRPAVLLKPGRKVRVVAGPFEEQLGTLGHVGRSGSVQVLLDIMNRSVSVRIDRRKLHVLS